MIAVFAGTKDGRLITEKLLRRGQKIICYNATKTGSLMYSPHPNLLMNSGMLDYDQLLESLSEKNVKAVIDATHPYAQVITYNLKKISQVLKLPYFRYERKSFQVKGFNSYEEIVEILKKKEGNVLVTTGSNHLEDLLEIGRDRLFIRILPIKEMMDKAFNLGFKSFQIIAMQGPFSQEMNKAILNMFDIKHMITKESGVTGGFEEKIKAANQVGAEIYILNRPKTEDEHLTYDEIIERVRLL